MVINLLGLHNVHSLSNITMNDEEDRKNNMNRICSTHVIINKCKILVLEQTKHLENLSVDRRTELKRMVVLTGFKWLRIVSRISLGFIRRLIASQEDFSSQRWCHYIHIEFQETLRGYNNICKWIRIRTN
jgi:hypothetical protein